jgi:hypothetical protein
MKGVRIIEVGGQKVGLTGVDGILERFYIEGWAPGDSGLKAALVEALRQAGNYVTPTEEPAYGAALVELFRQFCLANAGGKGQSAFSTRGGKI